ncbi:hypothetical protein ACWEKT_34825 [Nocardia takedensis]
MRPGLEQARDRQFGAFATWQVLCEYTRGEMRLHLDRGDWIRIFRGVYREVGTPPTPELRVEAARLSTGLTSVVAAYETAAELHGFAVAEAGVTHVLGARPARSAHLYVHRDRADTAETELVRGVLTTNAVRTVIDIARTATRAEVGEILEVALAQGISHRALLRELPRHRGRRGHGQAADLLARLRHDPAARVIPVQWTPGRSELRGHESREQHQESADLPDDEGVQRQPLRQRDLAPILIGGVAAQAVPGIGGDGAREEGQHDQVRRQIHGGGPAAELGEHREQHTREGVLQRRAVGDVDVDVRGPLGGGADSVVLPHAQQQSHQEQDAGDEQRDSSVDA